MTGNATPIRRTPRLWGGRASQRQRHLLPYPDSSPAWPDTESGNMRTSSNASVW
jgi:hypothetical protein